MFISMICNPLCSPLMNHARDPPVQPSYSENGVAHSIHNGQALKGLKRNGTGGH